MVRAAVRQAEQVGHDRNRQPLQQTGHSRIGGAHQKPPYFLPRAARRPGENVEEDFPLDMPPIKTFGERIADALVEDGLLSQKQVEELLEQQKKEGTRLLKLLTDKSYISETDMVVSMGRVLGTPPVNLARIGIPMDVANLLPKEVALNHKVVPVSRLENRLYLAMADPLNVLALDDVKRITKLEISPLIASEKSIGEKLNNLDTRTGSMEEIIEAQKQQDLEADADGLQQIVDISDDLSEEQLKNSTQEAPVIKLANLILVQAVKDRASDIHIEPFEKGVRLRYR